MDLNQARDGLSLQLGTGPYKRLHRNMEVKGSQIEGMGLFAVNHDIPAGDVVIYLPGVAGDFPRYNWKQITELTDEEREFMQFFSFQVGEDLFEGRRCQEDVQNDYSFYINHSCDPNCWYINDEVMIARREIKVGEEFTYDYITNQEQRSLDLKGFSKNKCGCGSSNCRGTVRELIRDDDELIEKYSGHFYSHIQRKIDVWKAEKDL